MVVCCSMVGCRLQESLALYNEGPGHRLIAGRGRPPQAAQADAGTDPLSLAHWGLPPAVLAAFHKKGLKQLYRWQAAALEAGAAGNNLVYCAPTSGGKSLVAEILMLARLHKTTRPAGGQPTSKQQPPPTRALLVLPYLSIVSEKAAHLTKLLADSKWRVQGYQGEQHGQPLAHKAERIAICSIEKANMAVNRLIQEKRLHELVSVVIDEAHMLADPHRGPCLEMLLTKLIACKSSCAVQIVAMSATMAGLDSFSAWLDAPLFLTNFRPVPLTEHAVFAGVVYVKAGGATGSSSRSSSGVGWGDGGGSSSCPLEQQRRLPVSGNNDRESLLALVTEVVAESHSVLVFCGGRAAAQSCAGLLADQMHRYLKPASQAQAAARAELVDRLRVALAGSTHTELEKLLAAGVAYHHAGLTSQERALIEEGYCSGALLVLTATSTLAAGVNLPARRVILRSLWQGAGNVSRAQYLQMVGRAGRAGQSSVGESFLMGQGAASGTGGQFAAVCQLLSAPLPALVSRLVAADTPGAPPSQAQAGRSGSGTGGRQASGGGVTAGGAASGGGGGALSGASAAVAVASAAARAQPMLQHLLLDGIAVGLVTTGESVLHLLQSTLAFRQVSFETLADAARTALAGLRARKLVSLRPQTAAGASHWALTPLGEAVVASTLSPELGLLLHGRLSELLGCLVLGGHCHLLYALQPDPLVSIFDWSAWQRLARDLSATHKRVAEVEGVDMLYIERRIAGARGDAAADARHGRLAAAVLLDLLVSDASRVHLLEAAWGKPNTLTKNGITRGQMQNWQLDLSKTAAMAALLASNASWWMLESLLSPLSAQAAAGVKPQLLPLMQVSGMQPAHAAALYKAGFERPELLVCAAESEVAAALAAGLPANMRKRKAMDKKGLAVGLTGSSGTNAMVLRAARAILAAARQHAVDIATAGTDDPEAAAGSQARLLRRTIVGQATVHQVWPQKDQALLQQLLDTWCLQPSFAFAAVMHPAQCSVSGCSLRPSSAGGQQQHAANGLPRCGEVHCPRLAALALCWSDREAAVLHLPKPPAAAGAGAAGTSGAASQAASAAVAAQVWGVVKSVFGDSSRTATCCGAAAALAALQAAGVDCAVTVDDPLEALALWQPAAQDQYVRELQQQQQRQHGGQQQLDSQPAQQQQQPPDLLRLAQSIVLGDSFKLQAPLLASPALTAAVRGVLLGRALMPPLRAVLAQQQLAEAYERVERPLQLAAASARCRGLRVPLAQVEHLLQQCRWQREVLEQQVVRLAGNEASALDLSIPSNVAALLSKLGLAHGSLSSEQGAQALLLKAVRIALRQGQQQWLPLLRCLLSFWQVAAFHSSLRVLQQLASGTSAAGFAVLQLQLQTSPLCGDLSPGLPAGLEQLLSHVALPAQPVLVGAASLQEAGVAALPAFSQVAVAECVAPSESQQQQQQQQLFLGALCSLAAAGGTESQGRDGPHRSWQQAQRGTAAARCVRRYCSVTGTICELKVCSSSLHAAAELPPAHASAWQAAGARQAFVPGSVSLLGAVQPWHAGSLFVGLLLELLPLAVLAGLSGDPTLVAALSQPDPLAAAADHWLQHGGTSAQDVSLLLGRVQAGALDGAPVAAGSAPRVLLAAAIDALLLGQPPSAAKAQLGLESSFSLVEPLLTAFPGVQQWQELALEQCRECGYLVTCLGRRIPFKLPAADGEKANKGVATRQQREAERTAISTLLLACCGDVEHLGAAVLQRCCRQVPGAAVVLCGARQAVAEVPSGAAQSLLQQASGQLLQEVGEALLALLPATQRGRLPVFKWWWGGSLSALDPDAIVVGGVAELQASNSA